MSRKPTENQKSGKKSSPPYCRSTNSSLPNNEVNSLERRLFSLIENELRRNTPWHEFPTIADRVVTIMRDEFVNDVMTEINSTNDEFATFFNRFIRSIPELNEICERLNANAGDKNISAKGQKPNETNPNGQNEEKKCSGRRDENLIRFVIQMLRTPILVTCRVSEEMRRIIRDGRLMIRHISQIAAMRSDLNILRRIDMKCVGELDHLGNTRFRRQVSLGNWRNLFRRCSRNIQSSSNRNQRCHYVVFDSPAKPRIVTRMSPVTRCPVIIRFYRIGKGVCKMSQKHCGTKTGWNESRTKIEIGNIVQEINRMCSRGMSSESNPGAQPTLPNITRRSTRSRNGQPMEGSGPTNNSRFSWSRIHANFRFHRLRAMSSREERQNQSQSPRFSSMLSEERRYHSSDTPEGLRIQLSGSPTRFDHRRQNFLADGDMHSTFSVQLGTGSALGRDITVVLYANRVLVAIVAQRSRMTVGGWTGSFQRRWVLPLHVDVNKIKCFLGRGMLIITDLPSPNVESGDGLEFEALGPPTHDPHPFPFPFFRQP